MALFAFRRDRPGDPRPAHALHQRLRHAAHVDPAIDMLRTIDTANGRWHVSAFATRTRFYAPEAQIDVDRERGVCAIHGLIWRTCDPRPIDAAGVSRLLARPGDALPADIAGEYAVVRLHPCGTLDALGDPAGLHQIFDRPDRPGMVANRAGFLVALADDATIDPEAGRWIAAIGYRVGGATARRGVRQLAPGTMLHGDRVVPAKPIAPPPGPRGFAHGGDALLERGIAEARAAVRLAAGDEGAIDLPITGGKDSRAVLAICLAAGLGERLRLFTRGYADNPDVVAGAAIAEAAGLPHRREPPLGSDLAPDWPLDLFHANIARLAFQSDGNMGGWDMIAGTIAGADTLVTGHMGELLKAYAKRPPGDGLDPIALVRLQAPFDPLDILRPEARAEMVATLAAQLDAERAAGAHEGDLPDLFYLRNRVPNWLGGIRGIKSFERQPVLPLGVPALIALAMLMTPEERRAERAHFEIVARAAPTLLAPPFAHQRWSSDLPGAPQVDPVVVPAGRPLFGNWQYSINSRPEIRAHLAHLFATTDIALWEHIDRDAAIDRLRHRRIDYFDGISLLGLTVSVYHACGLLLTERLRDPAAPEIEPVTAPSPPPRRTHTHVRASGRRRGRRARRPAHRPERRRCAVRRLDARAGLARRAAVGDVAPRRDGDRGGARRPAPRRSCRRRDRRRAARLRAPRVGRRARRGQYDRAHGRRWRSAPRRNTGARMTGRNQLVIGQSHVAAFRDAARTRREADPAAPRTRVIHTGEPRYAPELVGDEGDERLSPPLAEAIRDQVARHDPLLVSVTGGNAHAALALVRHERPFDFALSGEPSPPPDADAERLPESLVAAVLARAMAHDLARMRALHALAGPFVQVESPPPVRDDGFIAAAADVYFRDVGIAWRGVAGAGLRYRIWRLSTRLVRAEASALGCALFPVPAAALDADGYLRPDLAADATHGNAAYGEMLIEALQ